MLRNLFIMLTMLFWCTPGFSQGNGWEFERVAYDRQFFKSSVVYIVQDAQEALLKLEMETPFWRAWWFYAAITIFTISLFYLGFRYKVKQVRLAEKAKAEANEKINNSQIKALQAQMNPHFIFNCLNSINYYILESKPLEASEFLAKFSKLIRLFLEELNEEYISLTKEIQTLDLYLQLEQLRFGHKLTYKIETSGLDKDLLLIPTMIIQPFIENSIVHGIQPLKRTGYIHVRFFSDNNHLMCIIRDDGAGRKPESHDDFRKRKSFGIGLSSLRLNLIQPQSSIEIIDLVDEGGVPSGTEVKISFSYLRRDDVILDG